MLRRYSSISKADAREMIFAMGLFGNHNAEHLYGRPLRSRDDIIKILERNGWPLVNAIEHCCNPENSVPVLENIIGATWNTKTIKGSTISRQDPVTAEWKQLAPGEGSYTNSNYWALFELSADDFDIAYSKTNFDRFLTSVNSGIASVEGYLNYEYQVRRREQNPAEIRESIDWKVNNWIPALTNSKFDKGTLTWACFKKLRVLRDDEFQHPKNAWSGRAHATYPDQFNQYRIGICRLLLELHIHLKRKCPCRIIRYSFYPKIYWDPESAK